jgi:DNA-binding PadR family transcriptional regulator
MPRPTEPLLRDLELLVMLAVLGLSDEAYPLTIRDAIEERTGRAVARAAVFITLERLERKGFLKSRYGDPTPVRGGRAKRFFKATPRGVAIARESVEVVTAMTAGVELL